MDTAPTPDIPFDEHEHEQEAERDGSRWGCYSALRIPHYFQRNHRWHACHPVGNEN